MSSSVETIVTFNDERMTLRPSGANADAPMREAIRTIARNMMQLLVYIVVDEAIWCTSHSSKIHRDKYIQPHVLSNKCGAKYAKYAPIYNLKNRKNCT